MGLMAFYHVSRSFLPAYFTLLQPPHMQDAYHIPVSCYESGKEVNYEKTARTFLNINHHNPKSENMRIKPLQYTGSGLFSFLQ